jgi:hypothetical protein
VKAFVNWSSSIVSGSEKLRAEIFVFNASFKNIDREDKANKTKQDNIDQEKTREEKRREEKRRK